MFTSIKTLHEQCEGLRQDIARLSYLMDPMSDQIATLEHVIAQAREMADNPTRRSERRIGQNGHHSGPPSSPPGGHLRS